MEICQVESPLEAGCLRLLGLEPSQSPRALAGPVCLPPAAVSVCLPPAAERSPPWVAETALGGRQRAAPRPATLAGRGGTEARGGSRGRGGQERRPTSEARPPVLP